MYALIYSSGQFITNYGMQKWWFSDNIEIAYTFDNFQDALRFAHYWQIDENNEDLNVYTIYTKF